MILRDASFFRTMKYVPHELRAVAYATADAIDADFPNLPAQDDEFEILPPHGVRWCRRVGASSWWVFYSFSIEKQVLIVRTVNERA